MKNNTIKNNIAFKEVFLNKGYDVKEEQNNIFIEARAEKSAFIKEKKADTFCINLFDKELTVADAKKIINELKESIDLLDYINFMSK